VIGRNLAHRHNTEKCRICVAENGHSLSSCLRFMIAALKFVSGRLAAYHIPYMASESAAPNAYLAPPRMTRDIDMAIALDERNLSSFFEAFREGFYIDRDDIRSRLKRLGMFNLIETTRGATLIYRSELLFREACAHYLPSSALRPFHPSAALRAGPRSGAAQGGLSFWCFSLRSKCKKATL